MTIPVKIELEIGPAPNLLGSGSDVGEFLSELGLPADNWTSLKRLWMAICSITALNLRPMFIPLRQRPTASR
jgi:hypothetical protein